MSINPLNPASGNHAATGIPGITPARSDGAGNDSVTIGGTTGSADIDPRVLHSFFDDKQYAPFIAKDGPVCEAVMKRIDEKTHAPQWSLDLNGKNIETDERFQNGDLLIEVEGEFSRIDSAKGGVLWKRKFEGMTSGDYPKEILRDGNLFVKYGSHLTLVNGLTGEVRWDRNFGGNYSFHQINRLEEGDLVVHYCTTLYRIDGKTGETKWERKFGNLDNIHHSEQALSDGPIYTVIARIPTYNSNNGKMEVINPGSVLAALNPDTGEDITGFNKISNPTMKRVDKHGTIFFRAGDEVGAARLDGKEIYRVSSPKEGVSFLHMEIDDSGVLYATGNSGTKAISREGNVLWEIPESNGIKLYPEDPDRVFTQSRSRTYLRDRRTGEKIGEIKGSILRVSRDTALCLEGNRLSSIDTRTGAPRWEINRPLRFEGVLIDDNDTIYTFAPSEENNRIAAIDPSTGKEKWSIPLGDSDSSSHRALGKGGILFVSDEKHIWGIDVNEGKVRKGIRYRPEHLIDMKLNRDETALFIRDGMGNFQLIDLEDFSDVDSELRDAEHKFKEEVIGDGVYSTGENQATIEDNEEFINIDGLTLEKRRP